MVLLFPLVVDAQLPAPTESPAPSDVPSDVPSGELNPLLSYWKASWEACRMHIEITKYSSTYQNTWILSNISRAIMSWGWLDFWNKPLRKHSWEHIFPVYQLNLLLTSLPSNKNCRTTLNGSFRYSERWVLQKLDKLWATGWRFKITMG